MPRGRLIRVDDEVFEVVDEAPGGTSMLLINRSKQYRQRIADLERQLTAMRAELAGVEADASRADVRDGR